MTRPPRDVDVKLRLTVGPTSHSRRELAEHLAAALKDGLNHQDRLDAERVFIRELVVDGGDYAPELRGPS